MQNWKLDLSQEGDQIIFKDYQKAIIAILVQDLDKDFTSKNMHEALLEGGIKISRASVIFYLDFLYKEGLLTCTEKTGKGGYHRVYRAAKDWEGMKRYIIIRFIEGLGEALDEDLDGVLARWLE